MLFVFNDKQAYSSIVSIIAKDNLKWDIWKAEINRWKSARKEWEGALHKKSW